jgi:hypothetical protein
MTKINLRQREGIIRYLQSLTEARGIIFGFALLNLVGTVTWLSRWYQRFGNGPINLYPNSILIVPLVLFVVAFMVLIRRWWSRLLALTVSGWVLYRLGYVGLREVSFAHDLPLLSAACLRLWLTQKYLGQPQELLQMGLAFIISCYGIVALFREWRCDGITITTARS